MSVSWEAQDLFASTNEPACRDHATSGGTIIAERCPIRVARFPAAKGIRELLIRKGDGGKIGITIRRVLEGKMIVCAVARRSPAYLAGVRYGDEILCHEDEPLPGIEMERMRKMIEHNSRNCVKLQTKDKSGERYVTITRDVEKGYGFRFVNGEITVIRPNTSAEQQGLERKLQIVEVNEEVVVGMSDEDIEAIIYASGDSVTLCVVPVKIYRQLFASLSPVVDDALFLVDM
ncbi:syntenin-2-like [Anopheles nili]|uniref:syntenin-2-like n=1 Tax=Anopheles nili TaxID=185578 RepID=UPI00237A1A53|nr:syntenin-2-like [Anopheles nili]